MATPITNAAAPRPVAAEPQVTFKSVSNWREAYLARFNRGKNDLLPSTVTPYQSIVVRSMYRGNVN